MPPALGVSLSPRSPSTSWMRPTHPEEADLLLSKATDFNVNLIQQMAQKRLEYLTKHLGTVAQPGRHAELTGTDPRRSGTQLTRCPEPALGTGRVNRLLPLRGRAALGPFPTGHTSRTQPPGRQSHSRHRWSPRSDPLPSLAKATGFGLFSSRPRARLMVSHLLRGAGLSDGAGSRRPRRHSLARGHPTHRNHIFRKTRNATQHQETSLVSNERVPPVSSVAGREVRGHGLEGAEADGSGPGWQERL